MQTILSVMKHVGAWIQANPGWTSIFATYFLIAFVNTAGKYPKAAGIVTIARKFIDLLSPLTHQASPGTWKPPLLTVKDGQLALSFSRPPVANGVSKLDGQGGISNGPTISGGSTGMAIVVVLAAMSALGCNQAISAAKQSIIVTERTIVAANRAVADYDYKAQENIIVKAPNAETAKTQITQYRAERSMVVKAIADAQAACMVGSTLIPLVEAGAKKDADLQTWMADFLKAGVALVSALHQFGASLPAGM